MKNRTKGNSLAFHTDHRGFSLIELIIVVTIMGVLAGVTVPMLLHHLEESKIETDRDSLRTIYTALMYQYALTESTPSTLVENSFGGYSNKNNDIDIWTKGEPILEIDSHGRAFLTHKDNFEPGAFIYDALSSAGLDVKTLGSGGKIQLFHSKAMSRAVTSGGNHIMMTVDQENTVRVWVGSQSYNNGNHSSFSLPDVRFSFGVMNYQ